MTRLQVSDRRRATVFAVACAPIVFVGIRSFSLFAGIREGAWPIDVSSWPQFFQGFWPLDLLLTTLCLWGGGYVMAEREDIVPKSDLLMAETVAEAQLFRHLDELFGPVLAVVFLLAGVVGAIASSASGWLIGSAYYILALIMFSFIGAVIMVVTPRSRTDRFLARLRARSAPSRSRARWRHPWLRRFQDFLDATDVPDDTSRIN